MKKNKWLLLVMAFVLVLTLSACGGSPKGTVSYQNYDQIIEGTTTYNEVIILLGQPTTSDVSKHLTWTNYQVGEQSYTFTIIFTSGNIVKMLPSDLSTMPVASPALQVDVATLTDVVNQFGNPSTNDTITVIQYSKADDIYEVTLTFGTNNVVSSMTPIEESNLFVSAYTTPIGLKTGAWEWIILQIGRFTFHASNLFGLLGNTYIYWIGLLIMTLTIRTLAWPVYAKSNDMTIKMGIAQPELGRIQEKYRGKTDQASQQRMQLETMEVYKKYKINFLGCLMPLAQMPIFIAMYQVVQRFPLTQTTVFGSDVSINIDFLWTNLGNTSFWANLPLAIIVAATMFLSQWLMNQRTKANTKNVKYQNAQAQQTQKTMKYMMYFMTLMMGYIAVGNAGIAYYWIIGNVYQLFQSHVSHKKSGARQEQLRNRAN
ncbi:MAG: YidC/Oxa1 family membrane protein insertase [Candidatus Izemoplasmatales bacterium]|nr:YidC/Oxa1 family membrane protein insertase [Candidatus Izemoplasmatales bacterium]